MESCDQGGEDQDKSWLGLMDRLQWRKASQGFEAMDRETVKLGQCQDRGLKRSYDDMYWITSFMIVLVHWLHRNLEDGVDEWR